MSDAVLICPDLWRQVKRAERGLVGPSPSLALELSLIPNTDASALGLDNLGPCKRLGRGRVSLSAAPGDVISLAAVDQVKHIGLGRDAGRRRLVLLGRLGGLALVAAVALFMIGPFGQVERTGIGPEVTARLLVQQGMQAYDQADRQRAADLWAHALKLQPGMRGLRLNLAWLYYEMGRSGQALEQVRVLLDQNPDDAEAVAALEVMEAKKAPETESDK